MNHNVFNPFNKEIKDIEGDDLAVLRYVSEGWYIEYKRELVTPRNIAKSFAAFANHYGGWLFYGIEQSHDGENVAGNFVGVDSSDSGSSIERIRNAVKDNINPSPYYDHTVINGPNTTINLPADRCIIVIYIPSGNDTPYVHSSGVIYRRIADSSDPVKETDRFILDQLFERRKEAEGRLADFLNQEPELSEGEKELSFIDLFLMPDPYCRKNQLIDIDYKSFTEVMKEPATQGMSVSFDNFFTMPGGYIARQISTNNPCNLCLTWKFLKNGWSIVSIPLSYFAIDDPRFQFWLQGYEFEERFTELLSSNRHKAGFVIDLTQLIHFIIAIIAQQKRLMIEASIEGPLFAKASIHNVWRRIPFFDIEQYINFIKENGVPIIQFKNSFSPRGLSFSDLLLIDDREPEDTGIHAVIGKQVSEALPVISALLFAFGIPSKLVLLDAGWWTVLERIPNVNENRGKMFKQD